jgi:hypothetical protein
MPDLADPVAVPASSTVRRYDVRVVS